MAKHVIKKDQTATIEVTEGNSDWVVEKGVTLSGDWTVSNQYDDVSFAVEGRLVTSGHGFVSSVDNPDDTDNVSVAVGTGGRIVAGGFGIYLDGTGSFVENKGLIKSETSVGIYCYDGADLDLRNKGQLLAELDAAIVIRETAEFLVRNDGLLAGHGGGGGTMAISAKTTGQGKLLNGADGRIEGGVEIDFDSTGDVTLINKGSISAEGNSILLALGDDRLVNRGEITGRIFLYDGDDTADLRKGTLIDSFVEGGDGDDTFFVDGTGVEIREFANSGNDTIKTAGSYALGDLATDHIETLTAIGKKNISLIGNDRANTINGNSGNNTLSGGGNSDALAGFGGNDMLSGGDGADHFLFHKKGGYDTIVGFDFNADVIHLVAIPGIVTADDLQSHFTSAKNGDAIIDLGNHGSIRLSGIGVGSVDEIEFQIDL